MNILRETLYDFVVYFNPTTRGGMVRLGVLIAVLVAGGIVIGGLTPEPETPATKNGRGVTLTQVGAFGNGEGLSLIGSVEAVDQATVQSEVSGRVTDVRVALGDRVTTGQILVTLENASQYAALLQAEGAYEAAVAAAAQSDISVSAAETSRVSARNSAINAFRSAYNTVNSAVVNQIDTFFSDPDAQFTPGLRLEGYGYTSYLNNERVALQSILREWRTEANALSVNDNLQNALTDAVTRTERVREMVDTFIILLNDQRPPMAYTEAELASYSTSFTSLRADLNATLLALENARTSLTSAEETLDRARISGSGGSVSAADASVKQALGSLRAAQANYNKTILRSPITGVVQSLPVRTGDHIGAFTTVASVANPDALLITTYVSARERDRINVGDDVSIEGVSTGRITAIAPGIDPTTGKIEVQIQSESTELASGDTVEVMIEATTPTEDVVTDKPIAIPITALKVETDRMVVFTVGDDGVLVAHEVTDGPLLGDAIVITDGITPDMKIVTDARGLNEGDPVTVIEN